MDKAELKNLKILITGLPGTGKTTLVIKLAQEFRSLCPVGFYTEEIRRGGVREGFSLRSFDGKKGLLAHARLRTAHRVGKYGVDVPGFEKFLSAIPFDSPESGLIIIDEIGKMECLSSKFRALLNQILASPKRVIATIALHGPSLIASIKARPDVKVLEITKKNREALFAQMVRLIDIPEMS